MTGSALRWGLLSTASIGETVVHANRGSKIAEFVAVASRDAENARRFADRLDLPVSFASYEELLTSDSVAAVYVALPVSMAARWATSEPTAAARSACSPASRSGSMPSGCSTRERTRSTSGWLRPCDPGRACWERSTG